MIEPDRGFTLAGLSGWWSLGQFNYELAIQLFNDQEYERFYQIIEDYGHSEAKLGQKRWKSMMRVASLSGKVEVFERLNRLLFDIIDQAAPSNRVVE